MALFHSHTKQQVDAFLDHPVHALALNGEMGAGKGYTSRCIAAQLIKANIDKLSEHPYAKLIDASDKGGIEAIRSIQEFLTLKVPGTASIRRVVIIEHIDSLGHEAQNALLKTLEEPPQDTVIIVTYTRRHYVLPTIHSRLQTIAILPVDQTSALDYFKDRSDRSDITRAFYMSGGLSGLLSALLDGSDSHPLVGAISQARSIIQMTRFQRLAQIDKLIKDKDSSPELILDGMYRLLDASYKQSVKTKTIDQIKPLVERLKLIEIAMSDLAENVQAKLVLSRLFLEF